MTIAAVRNAMKTAIETVSGLRAFDYIQDSIEAPCAHVVPLDFDPRMVLGESKAEYQFQIRIYAARAAAQQNQILLDGYREVSGPTSVTAAVQGNSTLNAVVDYSQVSRIGEVSVVEISGVPYLYLEIDLEVCF